MASVAFAGFRPELIESFGELGASHKREWFQAQRVDYERYLASRRASLSSHWASAAQAGTCSSREPRNGPSCGRTGYFFRVSHEALTLAAGIYKRVPAGLPPVHPHAEPLRSNRLFSAFEHPLPAEVFSDQLPGRCFAHYQRVAPLQQWLVNLLAD